ncbi:autotransporter domain-containing protein [Pseudomonas beijingensis]|uniref:Autotransporter domain-containing protein n=1 Tax=Pseudomonas beijingensis TaxID=2954101 RepID=A0ABY9FD03_9PSED|nr:MULTISPECIES: autotransporter outer membrane beta-barrel domain-containing protein [unclassified Pseudomonas]WLH01221.1 autotransporter domain-containing protein [Pseudomonas sp. FP2034]WLI45327.1 autotransporter domain-containing protein [Pseudomonas sp. FP830]
MEGEWSRDISFSHKGRVAADTQFRNLGQIGAEIEVAGDFQNEGSVSKSVFVDQTGTFSGPGTVNALKVQGQLAVDPERGAPTIKRNLELAPGATLLYGIHPNGGSATIKVGGTAKLGNASLKIVNVPGEYIDTSNHVVIDAKKVDGEFGAIVNELAFMTATVDYTAKQVGLTYTRNKVPFEDAATTDNARKFVASIEEPQQVAPPEPSPIVAPAIAQVSAVKPDNHGATHIPTEPPRTINTAAQPNTAINALLGTNMITAANAIDQLSGYHTAELGNAILSSVAPTSTGVLSAMDSTQAGNTRGDGQVWVQAIGNNGRLAKQLGSYALKHSTKGLMLGTDWAISPNWRLGIIGSKTQTRLDSYQFDGALDSWLVGAYALRQDGPLALRLGAVYGNHDGSTKRHVVFNGFRDRLKGRYNATTQQVFGQVGYNLDVGQFDIEPYVQVGYQRYQRDAYSEKGGDAALQYNGQTQEHYNSELGLRLARPFVFDQGMRLTPCVDVGWKHLYGDIRGSSHQRLANGGNVYLIKGVELDRDSLLLQAGLDLAVSPRHTLGLNYSGETGQDNRNGALMGQWRMMF